MQLKLIDSYLFTFAGKWKIRTRSHCQSRASASTWTNAIKSGELTYAKTRCQGTSIITGWFQKGLWHQFRDFSSNWSGGKWSRSQHSRRTRCKWYIDVWKLIFHGANVSINYMCVRCKIYECMKITVNHSQSFLLIRMWADFKVLIQFPPFHAIQNLWILFQILGRWEARWNDCKNIRAKIYWWQTGGRVCTKVSIKSRCTSYCSNGRDCEKTRANIR